VRSADTNIPASSGYVKNSGAAQNTAWGVSVTGVLMFSSASTEGVDPFYPSAYGSVSDPSTVVEQVDGCLSHPQASGILHYHSASTCIPDKNTYENSGPFSSDVKTTIKSAYLSNLSFRSVFGLVKDGRPVYTPMHSGGTTYDSCDVDVCNGISINGHYSYVTTLFHPYIVGCYGPGTSP
jgi:hypothetical protein